MYQFDKLGGGSGFGLFHPNGNEVLVDEGVWDLRTHRLLRTLPVQDGTVMKPDPGGDVLYTYRYVRSTVGVSCWSLLIPFLHYVGRIT